jgi:arylformamidase
MEIYDISLPIAPDLPVWPGDPPVSLERVSSIDAGAQANVSRLALSVHAGTHVDAPDHFLNDGRTVESLPLEVLTGPASIVSILDEVKVITPRVLDRAGIPSGAERVLLKTRNSFLWARGEKTFDVSFVALSPEAAEWIVQHGVKLVGVDYLSVAPYDESVPTHRALLQAGVVILEGLDLSSVTPGSYDLYCLPLKLTGSDGAPARAILLK